MIWFWKGCIVSNDIEVGPVKNSNENGVGRSECKGQGVFLPAVDDGVEKLKISRNASNVLVLHVFLEFYPQGLSDAEKNVWWQSV